MAQVVGIDLGSQNAVLGVVQAGGVEIISNEVSNRQTPCIVAFGEKERYLGEMALTKLRSNFRNSVLFLTRFLGLRTDYVNLNDETKWLTNKVVGVENNKVGFEVRYQGQNCVFTCEKLLAMLLQKLKATLRSSAIMTPDICISVPGYLTQAERQDVLDACHICEINCLKLMNEGTAIALNYGLFRSNELTEEPRIVAFMDMGHSKTSCTIVQFTKDELKVLSSAHDRHLGGRDFDYILMEKFSVDFQSQYGMNPLKNPKARIRLQDQVEKARKVLSANSEANVSVECLIEDNDLNATISRTDLESMSSNLVARIYQVLEASTQGIDISLLHSIEIVGGATRIPMVQQVLKDFFKKDISRTLNAQECIARGCAVQAAILSPQFQVKEFGIQDITNFPISLRYSETGSSEIFSSKSCFPSIRSLTFEKKEPFSLIAFYSYQLPPGIPQEIGK